MTRKEASEIIYISVFGTNRKMTRKEAIEILKKHYMWTGEPSEIVDVCLENKALQMGIDSLETDESYQLMYEKAEVQPVIHGEWEKVTLALWKCSECGNEICSSEYGLSQYYKYCSKCGAKMDVKEEENEDQN